jgi:predicted kinase
VLDRPATTVVVAGLPGAGKTTLVDRLDPAGRVVLDSDRVRRRWAPRLGRLPYALWRPAVHAAHWLAVRRALRAGRRCVVVRPFTSRRSRWLVLRWAREAPDLVVVRATPTEARAGQRRRGRTVSGRAMARHERAWAAALPGLASEGWASVELLDRPAPRPRVVQTTAPVVAMIRGWPPTSSTSGPSRAPGS